MNHEHKVLTSTHFPVPEHFSNGTLSFILDSDDGTRLVKEKAKQMTVKIRQQLKKLRIENRQLRENLEEGNEISKKTTQLEIENEHLNIFVRELKYRNNMLSEELLHSKKKESDAMLYANWLEDEQVKLLMGSSKKQTSNDILMLSQIGGEMAQREKDLLCKLDHEMDILFATQPQMEEKSAQQPCVNAEEMVPKRAPNDTMHEYRCTRKGKFICKCNAPFRLKSSLYRHFREIKYGKKFKCTLCEYKTVDKSKLNRHTKSQHGFKLPDGKGCRACGLIISPNESMRKHKNLCKHN